MDVRATAELNLFCVNFIWNEMTQRSDQFCFTNGLKAHRPSADGWINCTFVPVCDCLQVIALVRGMRPRLEYCTNQNKHAKLLNWISYETRFSLQTICRWSLPTVMNLYLDTKDNLHCVLLVCMSGTVTINELSIVWYNLLMLDCFLFKLYTFMETKLLLPHISYK